MPTVAQTLADAARRLEPVTETPRLDAEILLAHAIGLTRAQLLAQLQRPVPESVPFARLLERRLDAEPMAYILGEWEFFSLDLYVEPPMFCPRPETEHLVEVVLEYLGERPARMLELGAGTGCISIAVAHNAPGLTAFATDINPAAVALAQRNAARHGLAERVQFLVGDLFDPLPPGLPPFDVICSNPPYVEDDAWPGLDPVIRLHEDQRAFTAGPDGLDVVRRILAGAAPRLAPGGLLAFEIGFGQYDAVTRLLIEAGYVDIGHRRDLGGIQRIAFARKPGP